MQAQVSREMQQNCARLYIGASMALISKKKKIAFQIQYQLVFHVSFKNSTSLCDDLEDSAWKAIGTRMLLQILQNEDGPMREKIIPRDILSTWHRPMPQEFIQLLSVHDPYTLQKKTVFLVGGGCIN